MYIYIEFMQLTDVFMHSQYFLSEPKTLVLQNFFKHHKIFVKCIFLSIMFVSRHQRIHAQIAQVHL